jgi:hypothetical protein
MFPCGHRQFVRATLNYTPPDVPSSRVTVQVVGWALARLDPLQACRSEVVNLL